MFFTTYANLNKYFDTKLQTVKCQADTKAYIISTLSNFKIANNDLSNKSLTILYSEARSNQNFNLYQQLGDWILFCKSIHPDYLKDASEEYYDTLAQSSYYSCYRLIRKEWKLYEELADRFPNIVQDIRAATSTCDLLLPNSL